MSTEIELTTKNVFMTSFWGGNDKGACIQLTGENGYVQLNLTEASEISYELAKFVKEEAKRRQRLLKHQIEELKINEKTVFNEIAELDISEYEVTKLTVSCVNMFCPISIEE